MEIEKNQPQPPALEETGLLGSLDIVRKKQYFKVNLNTTEIYKS